MDKTSQKILWIFLGAAIILASIWEFYPLPSAQARLNSLPLAGKTFSGKEIELTPFEQKFFKGISIIKRLYHVDNKYFFVTVLDGTNNRHVVHDPYYCFRGSGWNIDSEKNIKLADGMATIVHISKDNEKREALFWFSNGASQYASPLKYWWQTTLRRLTLGFSGPEPVLIMIQPITQVYVDWNAVAQDFKPLFEI